MTKGFSGEKFITAENEGSNEVVKLKNEIQTDLMRRYYNHYLPTRDQIAEWIPKYSANFQTVFDRLIKADPHFWLHDKQTRDATLTLVEDELYNEDGKLNPEREAEKFDNK